MDNPVLLASIGAAHGIKGEVRVKAFTADPLALGEYGALSTDDGRRLKIKRLRPSKSVLVVKFEGVNSREDAEALNGVDLFVDRSRLPDDTDEDEFYVTDLIGMEAVDADGALVGTVRAVPDFGAGSVLELATASGDVLLDFSRANVPEIDPDARRLTVILPDETSERDPET